MIARASIIALALSLLAGTAIADPAPNKANWGVPTAPPLRPRPLMFAAGGINFVTADRVAARWYAPETGGPSRPRFVTERILGFEARLVSLVEEGDLDYQERHVRTALDLHVGRDLLAELPLEKEPDAATMTRVSAALRQAMIDRIGEDGLTKAAAAEGISAAEIGSLFRRDARAAIYVDRAINAVLSPSENQLRDVFRTTANPYRDRPFDSIREDLSRWLVAERVKSSELGYLQIARSRVVLTYP